MTMSSALPFATRRRCGLLLAGCGDNQSVLNPKGPEALQLAQLSWLLFAVRHDSFWSSSSSPLPLRSAGPRPLRAMLASARTVVWAGIVFPAVTLTGPAGLRRVADACEHRGSR